MDSSKKAKTNVIREILMYSKPESDDLSFFDKKYDDEMKNHISKFVGHFSNERHYGDLLQHFYIFFIVLAACHSFQPKLSIDYLGTFRFFFQDFKISTSKLPMFFESLPFLLMEPALSISKIDFALLADVYLSSITPYIWREKPKKQEMRIRKIFAEES